MWERLGPLIVPPPWFSNPSDSIEIHIMRGNTAIFAFQGLNANNERSWWLAKF